MYLALHEARSLSTCCEWPSQVGFPPSDLKRACLPQAPWQRERHWLSPAFHAMVVTGAVVRSGRKPRADFACSLGAASVAYLLDHRVRRCCCTCATFKSIIAVWVNFNPLIFKNSPTMAGGVIFSVKVIWRS